MKTQIVKGKCRFRLKLQSYADSYYIKRITKLESVLARKPAVLELEMIGGSEVSADFALLLRSVLLKRSPRTQLVTNARSSLGDGSVLIWLLGDQRVIRNDARVYFKRNPLADLERVEVFAGLGEAAPKYKDSYSSIDPDDTDYERVLQLINEFLPVNEYAGRVISVELLREFGLVDNERVDKFLATSFSKSEQPIPAT
jgi:hypothetical protein